MASGLTSVFFGTPEIAATVLRDLVDRGERIVGVVTTPDKPQGRGRKLAPSAVKIEAERIGLPVLTPANRRDPEFLTALESFNADVFIVIAYKILPPEVYGMPRLGTFNIHASLLPKYRGAAPINWAIIRGEKETGLTTFLLDRRVDTGRILLQERLSIGVTETAGELHDRMMLMGADIAQKTLALLAAGDFEGLAQQDTQATTAPKIFPDDCKIDIKQSASTVLNFIRGLSPYPAAYLDLSDGARMKVLRAKGADRSDLDAGQLDVSSDHRHVLLGVGDHESIELIQIQMPGKRVMTIEELLRGHRDVFHLLHAN